ncbi:P-loop containing nucleoside triphosphate hydrolase protein [Daldinia caldariorum]|uniref:P-loop containing nucleoside triphosphate hydrolase protein n=1 Tax=Daldinia caldariorum TaxID=326644 RepID=UPI002008C0E0|nr:P-loop containing nucleoside triphosphate hydrolase protein [Daldinia caldariorum]KAI1468196.1 P-loop containing nucleoside triphosphate hydrolase protein [Daldinia caldariorum]
MDRIDPRVRQADCQRNVLEGFGGVGKSQLALEAAYRLRGKDPELSIFWVSAISRTMFDSDYRDIARQLGLGEHNDPANTNLLTKAALEKKIVGKWLLILDNADDVQLLFGNDDTEGLVEYLPYNPNGSILVTTRTHEVASRLDVSPSNINIIENMNKKEALQLLQNGLQQRQLHDVESVHGLLDLLAYVPLAVKQAAAYMARTEMTATRYLRHCRASNNTLVDLLSSNFEDRCRYKTRNPIATTWLISFEHISRYNPLAADYLKQLCFFGNTNIPRTLLPEEYELESDEALDVLKEYAFITEREESGSFDMHRLAHLAMRNWIEENENCFEWITKGIELLDVHFPALEYNNIVACIKYLPHTQLALQFGQHAWNSEAVYRLLRKISWDETAESRLWEVFELAKKALVAPVPLAQEKYEEAELLFREAFELRSMAVGEENLQSIDALHYLAGALYRQRKYGEAKILYVRVIELKRKMWGEAHSNTLETIG